MFRMRSVCFLLSIQISRWPPCFLSQRFVGVCDFSELSDSVSVWLPQRNLLFMTPYDFELEYEEGEDSSNSSESEYSDGSDEDVFGRLVTLDWCNFKI